MIARICFTLELLVRESGSFRLPAMSRRALPFRQAREKIFGDAVRIPKARPDDLQNADSPRPAAISRLVVKSSHWNPNTRRWTMKKLILASAAAILLSAGASFAALPLTG
ncbi:MAG: hypothetical protein NTU78_18660, partial [Alphaproteobacteria bacterium]|nr:hypothetical protein [Alphaproteobacteria bacterium]